MKATDKLRAYWDKEDQCIGGWHPLGHQTRCDLNMLFDAWCHPGEGRASFIYELDKRGYDLTTLKFSIEPKKGNVRFASQRTPEEQAEVDARDMR